MPQRSKIRRERTVVVLAERVDGVLARVAGLLSSRGFAIDSASMSTALDPGVIRLTLVVTVDDPDAEQIVKQLHKLVDVIKVVDLTDTEHLESEMVLVRIAGHASARAEVARIADVFRARIVDDTLEGCTLEATGDRKEIEALLEALQALDVREVARSGRLALGPATRASKRGSSAAARPLDEPTDATAQRRHARHPVVCEVRVASGAAPTRLWTRDVSRGGVSVATEAPLAAGTRLDLRLVHTRSGEAFAVEGIVRHLIDEPGFRGAGLEFVGLDDVRRQELVAFIGRELAAVGEADHEDEGDVRDPLA